MLLLETGEGLVDFVQRPHLVQRQPHDPALFGQRLKDRLAYPPYGVRNELESPRLVELLGGLDQPEISLVDHEPQVGACQFFERFLVALLDPLRQIDLFLHGDQILLTDLLQILVQRRALAIGNGFGDF